MESPYLAMVNTIILTLRTCEPDARQSDRFPPSDAERSRIYKEMSHVQSYFSRPEWKTTEEAGCVTALYLVVVEQDYSDVMVC